MVERVDAAFVRLVLDEEEDRQEDVHQEDDLVQQELDLRNVEKVEEPEGGDVLKHVIRPTLTYLSVLAADRPIFGLLLLGTGPGDAFVGLLH